MVEGGLPASEHTRECELEAGRVQVVCKGNVGRCTLYQKRIKERVSFPHLPYSLSHP